MSLTPQNFELFTGNSRVMRVTVTDEATGQAKNLSGAKVEWVMVGSEGLMLSKSTTGGGIALTAAEAGEFEVTIEPADTEVLGEGVYGHEAIVMDANGCVSTVMVGTIRLIKSVV